MINTGTAHSPRWLGKEKDSLILKVELTAGEFSAFVASPNDCTIHGKQLFQDALDGKFGVIEEYVEDVAARIKSEKDAEIAELQSYLQSTGWYIERLNDPSDGSPVPEPVLLQRSTARRRIAELSGEVDLSSGITLGILQIEKHLQKALERGFDFGGHRIQADGVAQQNANGYLTAIQAGVPVPFPIQWRTRANTSYDIPDLDTFRLFAAAMLSFVQEVFHSTWAAKDAIRSSATIAEVESLLEAYLTQWRGT